MANRKRKPEPVTRAAVYAAMRERIAEVYSFGCAAKWESVLSPADRQAFDEARRRAQRTLRKLNEAEKAEGHAG